MRHSSTGMFMPKSTATLWTATANSDPRQQRRDGPTHCRERIALSTVVISRR